MVALMFMDLMDNPEDEPLFTKMCEHYESYIMKVCLSRLGDYQLAEDCTWLTFAQAAKQFHTFDSDIYSSRIKNLLCTIAIAKCNRVWQKEAKVQDIKQKVSEKYETEFEYTETLDDSYWDQFQLEELKEAIHNLPDIYKVAVLLAKVEGYKAKEIAEICEITPETARKRVNLGVHKIIEMLEVSSDE